MNNIPKEVIQRFAGKYNISLPEATALFDQLEAYLDTAANCGYAPSSVAIDEAWHEFILHTRCYTDYCLNRYGHFIHHVPTSPLPCAVEQTSSTIQVLQRGISASSSKLPDCGPSEGPARKRGISASSSIDPDCSVDTFG